MGRRPEERKHGVTREKKLDKEVISTCLFAADKLVLDNEVKRTGKTKAEVVREVFHGYAMKKRFGVPDTDEESVASVMKKLLTEVTETRTDIQAVGKQTREITDSVDGLTELNSTEFKRLSDLGQANFNLASQAFSIVWAILEFFQRLISIPLLSKMPEHKADPERESDRQIYVARTEGLQLVEKMADDLRSPVKPDMILIGIGATDE